MAFGHEKLNVYHAVIESVGVSRYGEKLKEHRNANDQRLLASQAMALNIAEGNGNATNGDPRR